MNDDHTQRVRQLAEDPALKQLFLSIAMSVIEFSGDANGGRYLLDPRQAELVNHQREEFLTAKAQALAPALLTTYLAFEVLDAVTVETWLANREDGGGAEPPPDKR